MLSTVIVLPLRDMEDVFQPLGKRLGHKAGMRPALALLPFYRQVFVAQRSAALLRTAQFELMLGVFGEFVDEVI